MKAKVALLMVFSLISFSSRGDDAKEISALQTILKKHGFTGKVESTLPKQLGRNLDPKRVELGKLIFFDKGLGLHKDNSCAGCHSPTHGMGDTQSIAKGVQNNGIVGLLREGPRNQRRTPSVVNTGYYPALMWNGRFSVLSGNPFDNSKGFFFPPPEGAGPEGVDLFGKGDRRYKHLLVAQAHIPFTETAEMTGFTGLCNQPFLMPRSIPATNSPLKQSAKSLKLRIQNKEFEKSTANDKPDPNCEFDDGKGIPVPRPYPNSETLNAPIRHAVINEINRMAGYRQLFTEVYPTVGRGNDIEFWMIGEALAEFQISLTMTNAPIDKFARGDVKALTSDARKGALIFFGTKANCVSCHAVKGKSNEMFSDFEMHVAGVPQIVPEFGKGKGNVMFRDSSGSLARDGDQDLGRWEFLEFDENKYAFRTSPLRNVSLQAAFFHDGAFTTLEDAVRFHTDTVNAASTYDPVKAGVAPDLKKSKADIKPVLARLDSKLKVPVQLTSDEIKFLLAFLSEGLLDNRATSKELMKLVPNAVPSGEALPKFEP